MVNYASEWQKINSNLLNLDIVSYRKIAIAFQYWNAAGKFPFIVWGATIDSLLVLLCPYANEPRQSTSNPFADEPYANHPPREGRGYFLDCLDIGTRWLFFSTTSSTRKYFLNPNGYFYTDFWAMFRSSWLVRFLSRWKRQSLTRVSLRQFSPPK